MDNHHPNINNITQRHRRRLKNNNNNMLDDYLESLSIGDMIGQMSQIEINMLLQDDDDNGGKRLDRKLAERYIGEMGVGSVLNAPAIMWNARQYRETIIALNEIAIQYHRPPILYGIDSVHGANYIQSAIMTPQPINIAATFNTTHAYQAGRIASRDTRAAGIAWLFSPLIGIAIQSTWSRVYETFGEDPLVVGSMASAMIQGIQQPDNDSDDAAQRPRRAAACAKHFIGYSYPRTGHDRSPSWIPTRHLYQYFVPPWKRVLLSSQDQKQPNHAEEEYDKAMTVMESYTEYDGVPIVANRYALEYLLRYRLQFDGVLVTDYEEIRNLHHWHHIKSDTTKAIQYALSEGTVDMSMIPYAVDEFASSISAGIEAKQVTMERLKQYTRRILQLKYDLELIQFDEKATTTKFTMKPPFTIVHPDLDLIGKDDISEMVQDSIILAENNNNLLPLNPTQSLKIHVTGPTANSLPTQCGGWTHHWQGPSQDNNDPNQNGFTYGSTVWDSLRAETKWDVSYSCGVDFVGKDCEDPDEKHPPDQNIIDQFKHWAGLTPTTSMAMAVQDAKDADVTIICLGEEPYAEKPGDIRSLRLPVGQMDLVHAIRRNTNTKILLVYFGGRPRLLSDIIDSVDGVILAFLPGPDGGKAVVDIIAGRVNPSGRLPITYPAAEDGGGVPYWHAVTDMCTKRDEDTMLPHYEYVPCPVQWPFGHGLSYTTFEYSELSAIGGIDEDLHVTVTVKNSGNRAGKETVLFFTFDESRLVTPEQKRLRAFEKVNLAAGESVTIKKTVPLEDLLFIGPHDDEHYIYDPHMVSFLGIGSSINCRRRDDDDRGPEENELCVRLQSKAPDKPYYGHCDIACSLWKDSGCLEEFGFSEKKCSDMCISNSDQNAILRDSWGWNYVACLEQVVWGFEKNGNDKSSCWMMTSFCRDIFQNNSAITSKGPSSCSRTDTQGSFGFYLALLSSVVASAIFLQLIFGTFGRKPRRSEDEEERFRGIQFTTIRNGSNYV